MLNTIANPMINTIDFLSKHLVATSLAMLTILSFLMLMFFVTLSTGINEALNFNLIQTFGLLELFFGTAFLIKVLR